jgi:hypothetical protein
MKIWLNRARIGWLIIVALAATLGIVISLIVLGSPERDFTVTGYSDVVRFEAGGVATLQVTIYDLSGKEVWDSGMVSGTSVDWDRRNESGERMAYGAYLYIAQGWEAGGELSFKKNGKLALMPGDKVQLQQAPVVTRDNSLPSHTLDTSLQPMDVINDDLIVNGTITSLLTSGTNNNVTVESSSAGARAGFKFVGHDGTNDGDYAFMQLRTDRGDLVVSVKDVSEDLWSAAFTFQYLQKEFDFRGNQVDSVGKLGVGTSGTDVTAKLTVQGTSGDLIAAYNSGDRVFVVKSTGEVRADGAVYAADFNTGSADVAERINVSEWVKAGNVVEIDPEHPGFFRKSTVAYSTKVAGIISTSPGVILGNNFDEEKDDWEDNRPVLAVTGRVPCMVSTENGPISIGDLLVASSTPGVAMKGDSEQATGAVVGKAMEPLEQGEGTIVVQVMLR